MLSEKHFNLRPFNSKHPKIEKTACLKTNKTTTTIEIFLEMKPQFIEQNKAKQLF